MEIVNATMKIYCWEVNVLRVCYRQGEEEGEEEDY